MGMYNKGMQAEPERREGPHPIWRGIGCVLMVLIVVMSFAGATLLVEANREKAWLPVPTELRGSVPGIRIADQPVYYVELFVAFLLAVVGFGLFVLGYSLLFRVNVPKDKSDYY